MNILLDNFLWRFRYYLIAVVFASMVIAGITYQQKMARKALQAEATLQAEKEKRQQEESNRLAELKAAQEKTQREETIRLAELKAEQEKTQREEAIRLAEIKAGEEKTQREENMRLAKIQEDERQRKAVELSAAKALQEAEQDRAQKEARYVARTETIPSEKEPRMAVIVAEDHVTDSVLTEAIDSMVERSGFVVVKGLIKPEFISDGLFAATFEGKGELLTELNLTNRCEFVALCQYSATTESRPAFQDVIGASGKIHFKVFRSRTGNIVSDKELFATAAGFQPQRALDALREKLALIMVTNTIPLPKESL